MSVVYNAQLSPTKDELIAEWIAKQPWFEGDASSLKKAAGFRWDDPAGSVGMEHIIVRDGSGKHYLVPLTYRGLELDGGRLITRMEHSVLGTRYVYEAESDPVYRHAARDAVRKGEPQSVVELHEGGEVTVREPTMDVEVIGGPGDLHHDEIGDSEISVNYALDPSVTAETGVRGTWPGQDEPVVLVTVK